MKSGTVRCRPKERKKKPGPRCDQLYRLKRGQFYQPGLLTILILLSTCAGCALSVRNSHESAGKTVFFNSFEHPSDIVSWYWAGSYQLSKDTPPGGGKNSLLLKGIRSLPAASFISRPLRHEGYFTLECWGKQLNIGGYVQLATISNYQIDQAIRIDIIEPDWQFLQSSDTLYCPPNTSLMLNMQAGGPLDGMIMVDMLRIRRVR